jgi:hypothetical protein
MNDMENIKALEAGILAQITANEEEATLVRNLRLSIMTRQRRRAEVRAILMRINEYPKNPEPRKNRRKAVLGSVRSFMKMNPVSYGERNDVA